MARGGRSKARVDPGAQAFADAWQAVATHPLFAPLARWSVRVSRDDRGLCPADGWAVVDTAGHIHAHPTRVGTAGEWTWVFAHLLLHLGFGHLHRQTTAADGSTTWEHRSAAELDVPWAAACDVPVNQFLATLKLGRAPMPLPADVPTHPGSPGGAGRSPEETLAASWRTSSVPPRHLGAGTGGSCPDMVAAVSSWRSDEKWTDLFAAGLSDAVSAAIDVAGGARASLTGGTGKKKPWELALGWFVSSYPLLGAVASTLKLVADAELARSWDIAIAAVSAEAGEVYVNPLAGLNEQEWRFVLAHEMLHAALRHGQRVGGRDPQLFNVACDYVVNGWLVQMNVGEMPDGLLYDPQFAGASAEDVYDRIARDLRHYRKLATLRGHGLGDVLGHPLPHAGEAAGGVDLDEYYRRALTTGLEYHSSSGRGFLPSGLVDEIRALDHPPLAWDAALARWFEEHVPAPVRSRTYARPSRRQASTPDIPRAGWHRPDELEVRRTFGVVLDTSMSMDTTLLGKALGAIASYAAAREVPAARVVFCDAAPYDAGYLAVEDIAGRVQVKGRGGTVLQPAVHLLERAEDFPADGPILIITDGFIDHVRCRREHAWLIPAGATLPFTPRGPVFRLA